jgi:hypothetical protein
MRSRIRLVGVLLLPVMLLVACGGNGTNNNKPRSTAQLHAKLLNAADVGGSWRAGQPINPQDLAAFAQLPCETGSISPTIAKRLTAVTGTQFEPTDHSSRHLIELVVSGDPTQLSSDLRALFGAIESCSSTANLTLTKLTIPALGDQRAAYVIMQPGPSGSKTMLNLRTGYVRLGAAAVVLGLADFHATSQGQSQISDDTYAQLLKNAVAKLNA